MKRNIITLIMITLTGFSCGDDFFDLTPISEASDANFFTNASDIEVAVNGIYSELQSSGYYGNVWRILMEYRSDNIDDSNTARGSGVDANINKFIESTSNERVEAAWQSMYQVIFRGNKVLAEIENVDMPESDKNQFRAEVRFIRGLTYFNLVRLWGDVALLTAPLSPEEVRVTAIRDAASTVYTQIESDLTFAISNLVTKPESGRANQDAANALMGKVLITQGKHSQAVSFLREIDLTSLIPLSDVWDFTKELNDEMIFVVLFKSDEPTESHGAWYNTGETPLVSNNLRDAYTNAGDAARGALIEENNDLGGIVIPLKFQEAPFGGSSYGFDYPVIRKADVALLLAEALNDAGYVADGEAFDLLNLVRNRAGLGDITSTDLTSQAEFTDAIFEERRLELALEGHRWFDLQRSGKAVSALANVGITLQSYQLLFPIPLSEINIISDPTRFPQNDGY